MDKFMKRKRLCYPFVFLVTIFLAGAGNVFASTISRDVVHAVDTNPAPTILEADISADQQTGLTSRLLGPGGRAFGTCWRALFCDSAAVVDVGTISST